MDESSSILSYYVIIAILRDYFEEPVLSFPQIKENIW